MSSITSIKVPCTSEGCQARDLSTLYFINDNTEQKCKRCAIQALGHPLSLVKFVYRNAYIINADGLSDETVDKLLSDRVKVIEIKELSVITSVFKLVVKDSADPYRNQILTTTFLRDHLNMDDNA